MSDTATGGLVWNDKNGNGVMDVGEMGAPLLDTAPIKNSLSSILQTVRLGLDRTVGATEQGQYAPTWYSTSLGNRVWLDADGNGIQDETETGLANVKVRLYAAFGQLLKETTTDAQGNYRFDNLGVGMYSVQFVAPDGYQFTKANATLDWFDSDADANGYSGMQFLFPGQYNQNVDAGLIAKTPQKASIGDKVWLDANGNGQQDSGEAGLANVDVILNRTDIVYIQAPAEVRTKTDANGLYKFDNLEPGRYSVTFVKPSAYQFTTANTGNDNSDSDASPESGITNEFQLIAGQALNNIDAGLINKTIAKASLGDRVWLDANANGLQDSGEAGLSNVLIGLYNASGALIKTTYSATDGSYLFDQLDAGWYRIGFSTPTSYVFSNKDKGADSLDSDADRNSGLADWINLAAGEANRSVDAGFVADNVIKLKSSIGNRVWQDSNQNGLQDAGEQGVAGLNVYLYSKTQSGMGGTTPIATTKTDANGNYGFYDLLPGSYRVKSELPFPLYKYTAGNKGTDDTLDSDADVSGFTQYYDLIGGDNLEHVDIGISSMFVFPPVNNSTTTLPAIGDVLFNSNGFENLLSNTIIKTIYGTTPSVTTPTLNASNLFDQTVVPY